MQEVHTISLLRDTLDAWRQEGMRIGFVPTMGFLHEGHLSLIEEAKRVTDRVVVSIFVNPTQFAPTEDLSSYPSDSKGDCEKAKRAGASLVFLPSNDAIYPEGAQTFVEVKDLSEPLCAVTRPHHFRGVATVVTKLFHLVEPDIAIFGKKDYQQLVVIQRMVRDLHMRVEVVGGAIVREKDGLAMSSRNVYLTPSQRTQATALNKSLRQVRTAFAEGMRCPKELAELARTTLAFVGLKADYLDIRDALALALVSGKASASDRIFMAVRVGNTRLIDNAPLGEACSLERLDS